MSHNLSHTWYNCAPARQLTDGGTLNKKPRCAKLARIFCYFKNNLQLSCVKPLASACRDQGPGLLSHSSIANSQTSLVETEKSIEIGGGSVLDREKKFMGFVLAVLHIFRPKPDAA